MAKKKPGTPRPKRKCPHCRKIKFTVVNEQVGDTMFALLVCDNPKCKSVLAGGPVVAQ